MPSLRQYATAAVIAQISDIAQGDITDKLINRAEAMIDNCIAEFYEGWFSRAFGGVQYFEAINTTFTSTTLTITPSSSNAANYYRYTVIELVDGPNTGLLIPVISSTNDVLTFSSVAGLTGTIACQIYQIGKFPMVRDHRIYYTIPREIVEAVAYQVEFLFKNSKKINQRTKKSESIGESYSYTNQDGASDSMANRIAPLAKDILENSGYTTQTI